MPYRLRTLCVVPLVALALGASGSRIAAAQETRYGVYVGLVDSAQGSLDELTAALRGGFAGAGWEVLAAYDAGVERADCDHGARVLVLHSPGYAQAVLGHGPRAAFALPIRLALYQDEAGTHVAAVNPNSVNRTIVAEHGFEAQSEAVLQEVTRIVAAAVRGTVVHRQFGQMRTRGLIGRTMGVMAGGPFPDKIEEVYAAPGDSPEELRRVADLVWQGMRQQTGRGRWQIHGVYQLDLSAQGAVILGVSGAAMEARAFHIVGAGSDASRSGYRCPGLDHAGAFPVEVVVFRDAGRVRVTLVDEMYRMKLYFEDAGKMKFAANMGMPGSIEDEIRSLIAAGVGAAR